MVARLEFYTICQLASLLVDNLDKNNSNQRIQKSLKGRFLFVIGILFFLIYLVLGLIIIFWKKFPINMQQQYRIAFGVLLIVYAYIRFNRLLKNNSDG